MFMNFNGVFNSINERKEDKLALSEHNEEF